MTQEYPPLLIAVLICVALTGAVIVYALLMGASAPPPGRPGSLPAPTGTPGTPVATGTQVQIASRSFSISVAPASATTRPGETVRFTLTIHPKGGFDEPVQIRVSATALGGAFQDNHNLATVTPPYPPLTYEVVAPDLPPLVPTVTVDATVTATGGGIVRTERVQLVIRR